MESIMSTEREVYIRKGHTAVYGPYKEQHKNDQKWETQGCTSRKETILSGISLTWSNW